MSPPDQSPGFILHSRRFRENSRIIEIFTRDHGRLSLVARVSPKGGAALLQPFRELLFTWRGRRDLKNMQSAEPLASLVLDGEAGICGLYCNEVLQRVLPAQEPLPSVYGQYRWALERLAAGAPPSATLRRFEWHLLDALGYAADTAEDWLTGAPLAPAERYCFLPGHGFSVATPGRDAVVIDAATMRALQAEDFDDPALQRQLRAVTAAALRPLLGERELKSRQLMRQLLQIRGKKNR